MGCDEWSGSPLSIRLMKQQHSLSITVSWTQVAFQSEKRNWLQLVAATITNNSYFDQYIKYRSNWKIFWICSTCKESLDTVIAWVQTLDCCDIMVIAWSEKSHKWCCHFKLIITVHGLVIELGLKCVLNKECEFEASN